MTIRIKSREGPHALPFALFFYVGFDEEIILRAEESDADDVK